MKKKSNQTKLIEIILKQNPKISIGQAAKAYKILKELEKNKQHFS